MGMDWMWEDQIQLCLSESGPGMQGAGWGLNESRVSEDDQEKTVTVWGLGLSFWDLLSGGVPLSWGLLSKLSCFSGKEGRLSDSGQGPSWTGFLQHVCQAVVPAYNPRDAGREEIHLVWFIIHRPLSLRIKGPEPWAASWTTTAFALHLSSDPPLQLSVSSGVLKGSFLSPESFHPPDKKPMKAVLNLQPLCLSSEMSVSAAAHAAGCCCLSL